ncbi:glycosyltransferase [Saccharophagus sp. K07]|uniref:glycosyltransferase family 4 protein n=1 Tax=Saccharophagus sp. K07 TaxID=2283636 RepID=UPI001651DC2E|nr:glycosyltransferase family 4 protein [Saccharophagus sp. K07]MBC6907472.1 glycosyltransferase [Saccharophagus sp. K07]
MILRIVSNNLKGGARRYCYILNRALQDSGRKTATFIPRAPSADPFSDAELVPFEYHNTRSFLKLLLYAYRNRTKITLIHSHLRMANIYGFIISLIIGKPLVITCHGPDPKKKTIRESFLIFLNKCAVKRAKRIIHISEFVKQNFLEYHSILESDKHVVIYNGSDDLGVKCREPSTVLKIVVVGELTERKGIPRLIQELEKLEKEGVKKSIEFHIYGEGIYKNDLIKLSRKVKNYKVNVHGYEDDLGKIYHNADLHLILAINEGFGRVVTEAMSAGVPTIAYRSGAFPELIRHKVTGYLLGDEPLSDAISFFSDSNILSAISHHCRLEFEDRFSSIAFSINTIRAISSL